MIDQRLRKDNGFVDFIATEPIIKLMLEDDAPWRSGKYASDLLREWLHGHLYAGTPAGHPLRILLRERLAEACAAADRRFAEQREAAAAARAARTPEDIEREHLISVSHRAMLSQMGHGDLRRRERPEIPYELRNEVFLELLALLGPDLGDQGESILRRVAQCAPSSLAPALEEQLTDIALSRYRRGLLSHLTQAYYLDDEAVDLEIFDDGIRRHCARRGDFSSPLASWNRGPFMMLFQTDFRGGVAVLNRLLNHAAIIRARTLARIDQMRHSSEDTGYGLYQADLEITGTRRLYFGDEHVWMWYRGNRSGPLPMH